MKKIGYLIILVFTLYACEEMETVVDLEIPPHDPVLVLNGLLSNDTNVQVVVSHSVGAFSNYTPSFIQNASVMLYKDNEFIDSLVPDMTSLVYVYHPASTSLGYDSSAMYYYKSNYIPETDANYRIEVSHPDYDPISAETYIPADIMLYDVNIDTTTDDSKIGLTFSFDDNAIQQNYYRLGVYSSCQKYWYDEYGYYNSWEFEGALILSNDPSFPNDIPWDGYTFRGEDVVFSDALFNGQKKTISLDVETELGYADCDTVVIIFSTFSDDTYSYYNSLGEHVEKGEVGLFGGEVIPVYSNVENGLGVIISRNSQSLYLKP